MDNRIMAFLGRSILSGLLVLLPAVLVVALVIWLASFFDQQLKPILPVGWQFPGLGLVAFAGASLVLGILTRNALLQRLLDSVQRLLSAIPLIGPLYRSLQELSKLLTDDHQHGGSQTVSVRFPELNMTMLGLEMPEGTSTGIATLAEDQVLVYLPMTYQIGGYMIAVTRDRVTPLPMSAMEGMQFIVTGGMGRSRGPDSRTPPAVD